MSEVVRGKLSPPVEGGTGYYGSRGRLIDRLMGDRRIRARVRAESEAMYSYSGFSAAEPPPAQLPPAVPGGTSTETKGGRGSGPDRPRRTP